MADDLANLIDRLLWFLILSTLAFGFILFVELYWIVMNDEFDKSKQAWIDCIRDEMNDSNDYSSYTSDISDSCHKTIEENDNIVPSFWVFITLPILSLLT